MSNVYLDNNRIVKMKDVDKELKKIGTWRENISSNTVIKIVLVILIMSLCASGFVMDKKQHVAKEQAKKQFKQELQHDLMKNPTKTDSVYNAYIDKALSKQR